MAYTPLTPPDTASAAEPGPIVLLINGSGLGIALLCAFALLTVYMILNEGGK